ncbi:ABC transporter substrate-binding protein [Pseudorhodoferax sp.]|uniref:ABC transporter substrate-binding protein n=1 Tax=Pseudorhodoferax sp. TaxID=1993553 RepID=UPI002DD6ACEA|nr:ABC transporter substrate-binding protein [Pseudorhodoferax sp.]
MFRSLLRALLPPLGLWLAVGAHASAATPPAPAATGSAPAKVLRIALPNRENNLDPAQSADTISSALVGSLFDSPLAYDPLARPARLKPATAAALPEVNADHTHFVFTLKPGIFFPAHPAFGGRPRELVAADYVYSVKRYYDPAVRSPSLFHYEGAGLLGLSELRRQAQDQKKPFDYDSEVAGIRALDRYRFEVRVARPAPRLPYVFASSALAGALAREVVELDPATIGERPHGTGLFRLAGWVRGARLVLERNPLHRHTVYDGTPPAGDGAAQAVLQRLQGRQMPLLDRVEISIVEEAQPRWLSFLNGQFDMTVLPDEFALLAAPNGQVAPNLARQGIRLHQQVAPTTWYTYFNMEHPVVGGYQPQQVALRRAVALAYDVQREIDLARGSRAMPPQSVMPPGVSGYDPALKTEMSAFDLPRARALLDLYGYVDRDGDGWRELPDGQPLVLELHSEPNQRSGRIQGLWHDAMKRLGIRLQVRLAAWQENIKASRAGTLMMWTTGWAAALPDGNYFMDVLYGGSKGMANRSRIALPALDALIERQRVLPDGPERDALMQQALRLSVAYMPYKATAHPIDSWLTHRHVVGYAPHPFMRDYWRYLDIDDAPLH